MITKAILSTLLALSVSTCKNKTETDVKNNLSAQDSLNIVRESDSVKVDNSPVVETKILPPTPAEVKSTKTETVENKQVSNQNMIYLKEGENKFLKEYEMNVTFKKMTEDSRCPKDANCIWQGNAIAEIEVMGLYTRPMTLQLSSTNDANKGFSSTKNFNGYDITLVEVAPATTTAKGFNKLTGNYKIGIQLKKLKPGDKSTYKNGTTTR